MDVAPIGIRPFDTTVPNVARVWDALRGGRDNYRVEKACADALALMQPVVLKHDDYRRRVIHALATLGIHQRIELGAGLPFAGALNVPETGTDLRAVRLVFVDNDPMVRTHQEAAAGPLGITSHIILDDIRRVPQVLDTTRSVLDFAHPVAVIATAVLDYIGTDAGSVIAGYAEPLAHGSYLVGSYSGPGMACVVDQWNARVNPSMTINDTAAVVDWIAAAGLTPLVVGARASQRLPDLAAEMDPDIQSHEALTYSIFIARKDRHQAA